MDIPLSHASCSWRYPKYEYSYPIFFFVDVFIRITQLNLITWSLYLIISTHCLVTVQSQLNSCICFFSSSLSLLMRFTCNLLVVFLFVLGLIQFFFLFSSSFHSFKRRKKKTLTYRSIRNVTNRAIQQSSHIPFITETTRK